MADVFISYSSVDGDFARWVAQEIGKLGLSVFIASDSLQPGSEWSTEIRAQLTDATWVIFLASRQACQSAYVLQELGMALGGEKKLVPVVWDMDPSDLPGWVNEKQALDLRGASILEIRERVSALAQNIRADKKKGFLVFAAIVGGLLYLGSRG